MAILFDGVLYLLRHVPAADDAAATNCTWLAGSLASGPQGSLTASGVEFGFAWPCLNGGYFLFNRHGYLIPPFMYTDSDTERANPGGENNDS